jgi:2-polyprenyl-3-methyl-5-hydroxy-6-metoxy-1,4-benzoquinol methylase
MWTNVVNHHDASRLYRKLRRLGGADIADKLRVRGKDRVVAHWSDVSDLAGQWWDVPAVERRWNTFASGDEGVSFPQYAAGKWLSGRAGLRALSLGCGTGGREIKWAQTGAFELITGIDVSPDAVRSAAGQASEAGLSDVLEFRAADFREVLGSGERYDVVLGLHSLHHFDRISETMQSIAGLLGDGGVLIFDEYVGPTKFQWTRGQMRAANDLLAALPPERRVQRDGRIKQRVQRPSLLSMRLDDPSEAVESGDLLPALRRWFDVVAERPYGGTVLHIALSGIAQNFLGEDAETKRLLAQCFAAEDAVLPALGHDFVYAVARPKAA